MYRLAAFDWNGFLLADTQACFEADNQVIKAFGGNPVSLQVYRETVRIPGIDFYEEHGCSRKELLARQEEMSRIFSEYYESRASKCRTRKNARRLLSFLKGESIDAIILSNHTYDAIESQMERLKLKGYFTDILANIHQKNPMLEKNKLGRFRDYLERKKLQKNEIIIFGDSPEEVEAGKHLGITTVAITGGYYSTKRLKESNPDFLIGNLKEAIDIIKG